MARIGLIGCGYTGRRLVPRLVADGHEVVATTTTPGRVSEIKGLGATPAVARLDDAAALRAALEGCTSIVHLAPPDREAPIAPQVETLISALPAGLEAFVYGSTTGAFGQHEPGVWIDESTPSRNLAAWGRMRKEYEEGLAQADLPLRILRIAGIYGPGRSVLEALDRGMLLFEDGPLTSRVHVEDLARMLRALLAPKAPPLAIACDDEPAPTLEVARHACELAGREMPEVVSLEAAKAQMSPAAAAMRLGGRRCRSIVRAQLIGELLYANYREGLPASLPKG